MQNPTTFIYNFFWQNRNLVTEVFQKYRTSQIDLEGFGEAFDLSMIQAFGMSLVHYSGTNFGRLIIKEQCFAMCWKK
jgi:hypothetical protein